MPHDVDVAVEFPEGFRLSVREQEKPEKPDPQDIIAVMGSFNTSHDLKGLFAEQWDGWQVEETDERDATYQAGRVKQRDEEELPVLYVTGKDPDTLVNFQIEATVRASEPTVREIFTLHFVFDRS